MEYATSVPGRATLEAARRGDEAAFAAAVAPHRRALHAHCYRMLGSVQDAEDALQETLLRAWRGLPAFEERSSLRSWLHRIATNVALRMIERRPRRMLPIDLGPPRDPHDAAGPPAAEVAWLEPYPDAALADGRASPEARYEEREAVELAFLAALQHLPARQRAVLLLRDVLGFAPAEIAATLGATPAAVYSALQRARAVVEDRLPARSQQATLRAVGDPGLRELVRRHVAAWQDGDVGALVALLTDDVTFAMPPLGEWYRGREDVAVFLATRPLAQGRRWRILPTRASGQLAFASYGPGGADGRYAAHGLDLVTLDAAGRIEAVTAFLDPAPLLRLGLPAELRA